MRTSAMSYSLRNLLSGTGGPIDPYADPPQHGLNWPLPFPRCFLSVKIRKCHWINHLYNRLNSVNQGHCSKKTKSPHLITSPQQSWWLSAAMAADSQVVIVDPEPELELGVLAKQWEACAYIRDRLRTNGSRLVAWPMDPKDPKRELTGQPTMAGIVKNVHALTLLASWWCPRQTKAKTPSISVLRGEVWLKDQNGFFVF